MNVSPKAYEPSVGLPPVSVWQSNEPAHYLRAAADAERRARAIDVLVADALHDGNTVRACYEQRRAHVLLREARVLRETAAILAASGASGPAQ